MGTPMVERDIVGSTSNSTCLSERRGAECHGVLLRGRLLIGVRGGRVAGVRGVRAVGSRGERTVDGGGGGGVEGG
jgi:hypothetical protein